MLKNLLLLTKFKKVNILQECFHVMLQNKKIIVRKLKSASVMLKKLAFTDIIQKSITRIVHKIQYTVLIQNNSFN